MKLFKKGVMVPLSGVGRLCEEFELADLWEKIIKDPPEKPFISDGCSGGFPEIWKDADNKKVSLYGACLKHDIFYWSGRKGEHLERFFADLELMRDVVNKTRRTWLGLIMFIGVRIGGLSWLPTKFNWGFGRV